jgi:hypothetical protein
LPFVCFTVIGVDESILVRETEEYIPSDEPRGPATLRKKPRAGRPINSSHIDRNETDEAQRVLLQKDQEQYEKRKANGAELVEVLGNLRVLGNLQQLNEKIICNHLLDQWWDLRFSPGKRPIYLAFTEVHQMCLEMTGGYLDSDLSLEDGSFGRLYRSVAPRSKEKWVCFFLYRNQQAVMAEDKRGRNKGGMENANHFFPVVFDYPSKRAHCFGITSVDNPEIRIESGEERSWESWMGPDLWRLIGIEMGWSEHVGDPGAVTVVTKNWKQVGLTCWYESYLPNGF